MPRTVFIQSNRKQLLGAKLAAYAVASRLKTPPGSISTRIMLVEEIPAFDRIWGKTYLRSGCETVFDPEDLQSFTLTRFMPPELMGFEGEAVVIDPDIFALTDVNALFDMELGDAPIASCPKKDAWDTSVMRLDCARLTDWRIADILDALLSHEVDYVDWIQLRREASVDEMPRAWNSLDRLDGSTRMLHTTDRLTQPWRTGLKIDFTRNPMPKLFGIIPREPIHRMLGKYPSHYQEHPDAGIKAFFFGLVRDALDAGAVTEEDIASEIKKGHVRPDFMRCLEGARSSD